jgi:hypothetical protein
MAVRVDGVEDLAQLPWRELARRARERGIKGGSRMRKAELIEALQRQDPTAEANGAGPADVAGVADGRTTERAARRLRVVERDRRRSALIGGGALAILAVIVVVLALMLRGGGSATGVGDTATAGATTYKLVDVSTQDAIGAVRPSEGTFVVAEIELTPPEALQPFAAVAPAALVGGDGVTYEPSDAAASALGSESLAARQVQPGEQTAGKIAFDVPPEAVPGAKLVLRDLGGSSQTTFDTGL